MSTKRTAPSEAGDAAGPPLPGSLLSTNDTPDIVPPGRHPGPAPRPGPDVPRVGPSPRDRAPATDSPDILTGYRPAPPPCPASPLPMDRTYFGRPGDAPSGGRPTDGPDILARSTSSRGPIPHPTVPTDESDILPRPVLSSIPMDGTYSGRPLVVLSTTIVRTYFAPAPGGPSMPIDRTYSARKVPWGHLFSND
jgi:hypothetical protein